MSNRTDSTVAALLPWHNYDVSHALLKVSSSEEGLTQENADQRFKEYGANRLRPAKKKGPLARLGSVRLDEDAYVIAIDGTATPRVIETCERLGCNNLIASTFVNTDTDINLVSL